MSPSGYLDILVLLLAILIPAPFIGRYIAKVMQGERHFLSFLKPIENVCYRAMGVNPEFDMPFMSYIGAVLMFTVFGLVSLTALLMFQHLLPLNPQHLPGLSWDLALNTSISFNTNTNWQAYAGETTMSYLSQMIGLAVHNFTSAAVGVAIIVAFCRGVSRNAIGGLGNFWADLVRFTLYVLLPLSLIIALILCWQGVVQNFTPYITAHTLEGKDQVLPLGPAASQIAIKQLGSNGGGFFNVNSAFPYENPTWLSNAIETWCLIGLAAALPFTYGKLVGKPKQGAALFAAMTIMMLGGLCTALYFELQANPVFHRLVMEGKEARFGHGLSVLWEVLTTDASNGSVNAMHSSLSPIAGMVALINMQLGEVIFGGVGAGMYGIVVFAILAVFIAGQMVGRTPEYLGKKIEAPEVKAAVMAVLLPSVCILIGTALGLMTPIGQAGMMHKGPHGLSEVLYGFSSAAANNGSAFGSLTATNLFYTLGQGVAMLIGRFGVILPVLYMAGTLARKKVAAPSVGTFPTDGPMFVLLLVGVIFIVGALTFLPALFLGPIAEHVLMLAGKTF